MPIDLAQCRFKIGDERRVGTLAGRGAGDDHVIRSRPALARQYCGGDRPQPPLCPVADHRIADLAARGEADPDRLAAICFNRPRRRLQDKAGPYCPATSCGDTKKIGACLEPCKAGCRARHRKAPIRHAARRRRGRKIRPTGVCDPSRAALPAPGGPQGWPCAHENRGGACGRACWAGKCASRHRLQRQLPGLSGGRYIGERSGRVNDAPGRRGGKARGE
jgi:hypothetical protein